MSNPITLNAQPRQTTGKAVAQLRRAGLTPIVVYGPKAEPVSLQVAKDDLEDVLSRAGTTGIVHIQVDGEGAPRKALARARQLHPTDLGPLHVDFLQVDEAHEVRTRVPVRVVGAAPGPVRRNEAVLRVLIGGVDVRSNPVDLPGQIDLDCSGIESMGQVLRVRDLVPPSGVAILTPGDRPVARLAAIRRGGSSAGSSEAAG